MACIRARVARGHRAPLVQEVEVIFDDGHVVLRSIDADGQVFPRAEVWVPPAMLGRVVALMRALVRCSRPGCGRKLAKAGLCRRHYEEARP